VYFLIKYPAPDTSAHGLLTAWAAMAALLSFRGSFAGLAEERLYILGHKCLQILLLPDYRFRTIRLFDILPA
jgi:hypothetical protein